MTWAPNLLSTPTITINSMSQAVIFWLTMCMPRLNVSANVCCCYCATCWCTSARHDSQLFDIADHSLHKALSRIQQLSKPSLVFMSTSTHSPVRELPCITVQTNISFAHVQCASLYSKHMLATNYCNIQLIEPVDCRWFAQTLHTLTAAIH